MTYPADVLDLVNWKITLPVGAAEKPTEVKQPALATFSDPKFFHPVVTPFGEGVACRAPVNGVTTGGSANPRAELREMVKAALAVWSSSTGWHALTVLEAVTRIPN